MPDIFRLFCFINFLHPTYDRENAAAIGVVRKAGGVSDVIYLVKNENEVPAVTWLFYRDMYLRVYNDRMGERA